ncbi:hypothetical protein [Amantichitinum ursilacus]|uniref:Uncharacterized protein n=1 Tax=Amantichitinum ursilacus TaxID=857265 RepID=A0A0N0GM00_9NEIS|nr:hypothetical protein [Amantichitinum ursilacus]KPC50447.1 hypothetical protein WG78_17605 [Amantichitinum ursilacus]
MYRQLNKSSAQHSKQTELVITVTLWMPLAIAAVWYIETQTGLLSSLLRAVL